MKKLIPLMLGLGLVIGTVSYTFAQDDTKKEDSGAKKGKKGKKGKKSGDEKKDGQTQ